MKSRSFQNQQVYGDTLLMRLGRSPRAGALKREAQAFKGAQNGYTKACDKVAASQARRDDALLAIAEADDGLDHALLTLADRLVGAGLGLRKNPFADYSSYSPSRLTALGYAEEAKEARALLAALRKKKLSADLGASVKAALLATEKVAAALKGLAAPQADYEAAMQDRDGLLLQWNKALGRLKRAAAVVYDEDRAGYRALFAPSTEVLTPVRRTRKKAPKPAAPPA